MNTIIFLLIIVQLFSIYLCINVISLLLLNWILHKMVRRFSVSVDWQQIINLNKPITHVEIKVIIKIFSTKKSLESFFSAEFHQI